MDRLAVPDPAVLATPLMTPHYDPGVVALSLAMATFAAYVALDLARRVHGADRLAARTWMAGGALVLGSGIWAMHFVGMLAFVLPIPLGYGAGITAASWLAAVAVSGLALGIASRDQVSRAGLAVGAIVMGGGIATMHYTGMAALDMAPGIVWHRGWVVASVAIAMVASAVALWIFFAVRHVRGTRARWVQMAAALVMGAAISGMHYSGMAAAGFPQDAICLSSEGLHGSGLGTMVVMATVLLLTITLFTTSLDAQRQARATLLSTSLDDASQQLSAAHEELQRRALCDPLTGVPTISLFDDRLQHAVARVNRQGQGRIAVLYLDLDGFKPVNDSWGHATGDALLRQVAARLRAVCREVDTLARVGADEFIVLLEDAHDTSDIEVVARRMLQAVARPSLLEGREVLITCSVGIAVYPDHGPQERLKAHADAAMQAAKAGGGNRLQVYDESVRSGSDPMDLLQDLRQAIELGQLELHYQPKVDARTGRVRSVEALMRWRHPQRGMIPPGVFIPLAERHGLIVALGHWALNEACRQIAAWSAQGQRLRVAVNLSAWQVRQSDFIGRLRDTLARHGAEAGLLVCEFTESVAMDDALLTQRVIDALETLGVQVSLDDFGTGYSSLAMLRQLRLHELKIDRLFVRDVAQDTKARDLVEAVVRIAHVLEMRVVAEGVETLAQAEALSALGCDELQGFYFARPMPAEAITPRLRRADSEEPLAFSPSAVAPLAS
jgi:diguanylate cyclase (GGDEF)-like protein